MRLDPLALDVQSFETAPPVEEEEAIALPADPNDPETRFYPPTPPLTCVGCAERCTPHRDRRRRACGRWAGGAFAFRRAESRQTPPAGRRHPRPSGAAVLQRPPLPPKPFHHGGLAGRNLFGRRGLHACIAM